MSQIFHLIFIHFRNLSAAKIATGESLLFLDSHVEVLNGWMLYLLEEIKKDRFVLFLSPMLIWDFLCLVKQLFVQLLMY